MSGLLNARARLAPPRENRVINAEHAAVARAEKQRGLHLLPFPHLFSPFKVISSVLSPHLSRRWMRNQPCAAAYVRAGSFPLSASRCNLNSIQHSPFSLPCLHETSLQMWKKVTLISDKNTSPKKRGKKRSRSRIIYLLLYYLRVLLFSPRVRAIQTLSQRGFILKY